MSGDYTLQRYKKKCIYARKSDFSVKLLHEWKKSSTFADKMKHKMTDELYIARCFQLARLGEYYVAPNPIVGGVLVS